MKLRPLFYLLLLSQASVSVAGAADPRSGTHLLALDEDFPAEQVKTPGVQVHPTSEAAPTELLPANAQYRMLKSAGLEDVLEWDALDRDRFFLRSENQSAAEVASRYEGKVPAEKIATLQKALRFYRASIIRKGGSR
jgi:hypothetical protein